LIQIQKKQGKNLTETKCLNILSVDSIYIPWIIVRRRLHTCKCAGACVYHPYPRRLCPEAGTTLEPGKVVWWYTV
jgi:hypothetical protein